jgi:hypothetical protein
MALIIPEAQSDVSIVQQPRISPALADTSGIQAVGDVFVALGAKKVAAENDRTVRQARLSAIQALDEARLKYETTGELENLTGSWEAEAAAITAKAAEAVPIHLRKDFSMALGEVVAPQTSAIRRREFALFQDRETAALNSDLRSYEKAAAAAPTPEARDKIMAEAAADLGRAVTSGLLSATQGRGDHPDGRGSRCLPGAVRRIRGHPRPQGTCPEHGHRQAADGGRGRPGRT